MTRLWTVTESATSLWVGCFSLCQWATSIPSQYHRTRNALKCRKGTHWSGHFNRLQFTRAQPSDKSEKAEASIHQHDSRFDPDIHLRLHWLSSNTVIIPLCFLTLDWRINFRTKALKGRKTFEITAKLTKPSQSIIVIISSVSHSNVYILFIMLIVSRRVSLDLLSNKSTNLLFLWRNSQFWILALFLRSCVLSMRSATSIDELEGIRSRRTWRRSRFLEYVYRWQRGWVRPFEGWLKAEKFSPFSPPAKREFKGCFAEDFTEVKNEDTATVFGVPKVEPKRLQNGKYESASPRFHHRVYWQTSRCNHSCKDKTQCRHFW